MCQGGRLLAALSEDHVDRELLTAAGEIIQALISGGPAEGIDDYEDASLVIEYLLDHMATSAETVEDFLHVNSIMAFSMKRILIGQGVATPGGHVSAGIDSVRCATRSWGEPNGWGEFKFG